MKKVFLFILATMLAQQALAQNFTIDNLNYEVIDTKKHYVSVCKSEIELKDSLFIPSNVKNGNITYMVISIADYAFYDCSGLTSVIIPESVTSIGRSAFYGCCSLTSIIIPYSVGTIYEEAFRDCNSLTSIVITRASTIKKAAFSGCSNLTSISLPSYACEQTNTDIRSMTTYYYPFGYIFGELEYDGGIQTSQPTYYYNYYYDVNFGGGYNESKREKGNSANYYIPANLKEVKITKLDEYSIPDGAFINCDNLTIVCGHKVVTDAAIAATCTKSGLTEGKHCSICNEVLESQDTIPALGHTIVVDAAITATATESGLTEGSHCSVCGKVIVAQTIIPTLGEQGSENGNQGGAQNNSEIDKENQDNNSNNGENNNKKQGDESNNSQNNENQGNEANSGDNQSNVNDNNGNQNGGANNDNDNNGGNNGGTNIRPIVPATDHVSVIINQINNVLNIINNITTDVEDEDVCKVSIYAHHNTIVVENATDEIRVYDAMGRLVDKNAGRNATITVKDTGIYIVKTGATVKRVMVN